MRLSQYCEQCNPYCCTLLYNYNQGLALAFQSPKIEAQWKRLKSDCEKRKVDQNFSVFDHEKTLLQWEDEFGGKKAFEDNHIMKQQKDR